MKNIVLLAAALFILIRASAAQAAPTVSWLPDGQPFDVGFEPTVALANPSSGVQIVSVHQGSTGSNRETCKSEAILLRTSRCESAIG